MVIPRLIIQLIFFVVMILPNCAWAKDAMPRKLTASYFEHPAMPPFIYFIKGVYAELNIKLETVPLPASRGIMELNRGLIDVDIVRPYEFVTQSPNIYVLQPPLYTGKVVLICNRKVKCDLNILNNKKIDVMTTLTVRNWIKNSGVKANLVNFEDPITTLELVKEGKVDYVLYGSTDAYKKKLQKEFNVVLVKNVELHHVINDKHKSLVPKLEMIIRRNLNDFDPDGFSFGN